MDLANFLAYDVFIFDYFTFLQEIEGSVMRSQGLKATETFTTKLLILVWHPPSMGRTYASAP
jgi:hypothetical protein